MFAESLLETSWAQRSRRGWMTATSFGVQAVIVGLLIGIPLLTTVGIPLARTVSTPIMLGHRDPGPAPVPDRAHNGGVRIAAYSGPIMEPGRVPSRVYRGPDLSPAGPNIGIAISDALPLNPSGIPMPITGTRPLMPIAAPPTVRKFLTSSLLQGSLIRRVEPVYPPLARAARVQGPVLLEAIIGKDGSMQNLQVISGHPMLVSAAITAVSQWRYRPYVLNGEAIEVETRIMVNFVLGN